MEKRLFAFVSYKFTKILFILMLIILMILWIVEASYSGQQMADINGKIVRSRGDERRMIMQLKQSSVVPLINRSTLPRIQLLIVFNTLIQEMLAIAILVCLLLNYRKTYFFSLVMLTLIWFIKEYRFGDYYNQIDSLDWKSSQIIVSTHSIYFIVVVLGFLCCFFNKKYNSFLIADNNADFTDSKITNQSPTTNQLTEVTIEPTIDKQTDNEECFSKNSFGNKFKNKFDWILSNIFTNKPKIDWNDDIKYIDNNTNKQASLKMSRNSFPMDPQQKVNIQNENCREASLSAETILK